MTADPKVHAKLSREVHAALKHLRETLGKDATLSDAVAHALTMQRSGMALQVDKNAPPKHYFGEFDAQGLPEEIRWSRLNLVGILDLARTLSGRSTESLLSGRVRRCRRSLLMAILRMET